MQLNPIGQFTKYNDSCYNGHSDRIIKFVSNVPAPLNSNLDLVSVVNESNFKDLISQTPILMVMYNPEFVDGSTISQFMLDRKGDSNPQEIFKFVDKILRSSSPFIYDSPNKVQQDTNMVIFKLPAQLGGFGNNGAGEIFVDELDFYNNKFVGKGFTDPYSLKSLSGGAFEGIKSFVEKQFGNTTNKVNFSTIKLNKFQQELETLTTRWKDTIAEIDDAKYNLDNKIRAISSAFQEAFKLKKEANDSLPYESVYTPKRINELIESVKDMTTTLKSKTTDKIQAQLEILFHWLNAMHTKLTETTASGTAFDEDKLKQFYDACLKSSVLKEQDGFFGKGFTKKYPTLNADRLRYGGTKSNQRELEAQGCDVEHVNTKKRKLAGHGSKRVSSHDKYIEMFEGQLKKYN